MIAHGRGLLTAIFIRIRIEDAALKAHLLHTALELSNGHGQGLAAGLRQAGNADEDIGVELGLAINDIIGLFGKPLHHARRLGAVHHLEGAGGDALHIRAHFFEKIHMALVATFEMLDFDRPTDLIIADCHLAATMGTQMREDGGLIGP